MDLPIEIHEALFEIAKKDDIHYFEHTIIGDFDIIKQYVQTRYIKAKEANHKELPLQRLYFSKKFYSLYSDLLNLQTNPFIPKEIKVHIKNTIDNIEKNLHSLYISLSIYMTKEKAESYREILTHFEPQKIDHQKDLEKFRNVITEYFKVNKI